MAIQDHNIFLTISFQPFSFILFNFSKADLISSTWIETRSQNPAKSSDVGMWGSRLESFFCWKQFSFEPKRLMSLYFFCSFYQVLVAKLPKLLHLLGHEEFRFANHNQNCIPDLFRHAHVRIVIIIHGQFALQITHLTFKVENLRVQQLSK